MQRRYVGTNLRSDNGSSTTKAIERVLAGEAEARAPTPPGPAPPALRGGALRRYRDIALGLALSDAVCVVVALAVAYYLRFPDRRMLAGEAIVLAVAPVLWVAVFHAFDLYAPQHLSAPEEFRRLIGASSVGIVLLVMASYWSKSSFSRGWVAISWILVLVLELIPRRWWRAYQWRLRMDGRLALRTLVVGTSAQAARLVEILSDRASGFLPVGQVRAAERDEDGFATPPGIRAGRDQVPSPLPVLGGVDDLDRLIREQGAECMFVAPPGIPVDDMARVAWTASRQRIEVRVLANLPQTLTSRLALVKVGPAIAFALKPVRLSGRQAAAKRAFDLVVASAALLLSLPLLLLIALWIRLDSGGPVFFSQERVTKDGRVFRMRKFRTMGTGGAVPGDATRPFFKLEDDPRLTRAGAFLRRYSLDELPQFWNVLVGEMSIVGPRPLPLAQVTANLELLAARHVVPAGVTGWWQINGRSLATPEESLRLDLFYIENWSLALDLYVVLKTFGAVLGRQGAY